MQSFTPRMPLLTATGTFGLGRIHWSSPKQCYLHCLCTLHTAINNMHKKLGEVLADTSKDMLADTDTYTRPSQYRAE